MSDIVELSYVRWGVLDSDVAEKDMYKASKIVDGVRVFPYIEIEGKKVYLAVDTPKDVYL